MSDPIRAVAGILEYPRRLHADFIDSLRQRPVRAGEIRSIITLYLIVSALDSIFVTFMGGVFFIFFADAVGVTYAQWGYLHALSAIGPFVSAVATERIGHRKAIWLFGSAGARILWFGGVVAAFALSNHGMKGAATTVIILSTVIGGVFSAISNPPWQSWLAAVIPASVHGRFWGFRSAIMAIAVTAAIIPAAWFLDSVPKEWKLQAVMLVFSVGFILSVFHILIHLRIPEPPVREDQSDFFRQLRRPLKDKGFQRWLLFVFIWTFGMSLGGSLATNYFVREMDIKNHLLLGVIVLTVASLVGVTLTGRFSGRLVDRLGPKRGLVIGHIGWALLPAFWIFMNPDNRAIIMVASSLWGGLWCTMGQSAQTKLVTRYPAPECVTVYAAVSACFVSMASTIAALTAGQWVQHFRDVNFLRVHGYDLTGWHMLFIASLVVRLSAAVFLAPRVKDPPRRPVAL